MADTSEAQHLNAARRRFAMLDGARFLLSPDGDGMMLDARGRDGSLVTIARFTGHASQDEMEFLAASAGDAALMHGLVDRAIDAARRRRGDTGRDAPPELRQPDHTTEAAMLCTDPAFKRFLMERHGLDSPATDERTAQRLRSLLGVTSRREINQSDAARERWMSLRGEFRTWKGRERA